MNEHWSDRLSDYLDGDLSADERARCEAHLLACSECRAVLEELRTIVDSVRSDPEQMPSSDLWPGIASRLETAALSESGNVPGESTGRVVEFRQPRRVSFTIAQLALAASLLIAVSSGVSWFLAKRPAASNGTTEPVVMAQNEPFAPPSADVKPVNFADAAYDAAVADFEKILAEQRDHLDPRTVRVLERNLQMIDEAIRQSRQALASDPNNPFLNSHLADSRQRKLELLRRAALLAEGGD